MRSPIRRRAGGAIISNALIGAIILVIPASLGVGVDAGVPDSEPISTLPFHLKDGFILVDGQVDGTRGVFMLDTGMPFRILLNRHYVPLDKGMEVKRGRVASGQAMIIQSHNGSHPVELAGGTRLSAASGARFTAPQTVLSGDFGFIEKAVTPRFLGFIGWGLLKNYVFVVDYDRHAIPLYPLGRDGTSPAHSIKPDRAVRAQCKGSGASCTFGHRRSRTSSGAPRHMGAPKRWRHAQGHAGRR
jgi:hypothetical protein